MSPKLPKAVWVKGYQQEMSIAVRQRVSQPRIAYAFTDEWDTYASADLLIPTAALEKGPHDHHRFNCRSQM